MIPLRCLKTLIEFQYQHKWVALTSLLNFVLFVSVCFLLTWLLYFSVRLHQRDINILINRTVCMRSSDYKIIVFVSFKMSIMDTWHERGKRNLNNIDRLKETEYGIETITCMIHVIQSINQHYSKFVHLHKIATTNVQRFIVTHFVINFSTVPLMVADSINASQIPNHFLHRTFIDIQQVLSDDKIEVCIIVT